MYNCLIIIILFSDLSNLVNLFIFILIKNEIPNDILIDFIFIVYFYIQ
jgi:hypothetical protein